MRTDTFLATSTPGVYTAPMSYFDQLTIDGSGDFELRDKHRDGEDVRELQRPEHPRSAHQRSPTAKAT